MKMRVFLTLLVLSVLLVTPGMAQGPEPQMTVGTPFTYQGVLRSNNNPVSGTCDFQFSLWDSASGGSQVGATWPQAGVTVTRGLFTVLLDFGSAPFQGANRYLEVAVRCPAGSGAYTTLSPRQALTPAPYALYAAAAHWANLLGIPAGFADNVDNDTTYTAGAGLTLVGTQFNVVFAGTGTASTVARSDHDHDARYWKLGGNSGTTPGVNYLGTSDNTPLELKVNSLRALRLEPSNISPNVVAGFPGNNVIAGGAGGTVSGGGGSGTTNRVTDSYGTVGGGSDNQAGNGNTDIADAMHATVGGGFRGTAGAAYATVAGGYGNTANNTFTTVGGGNTNTASGLISTVAGGWGNEASGAQATIAGGWGNIASGQQATVGGGKTNTASAMAATVGGGQENRAQSPFSTIGGGLSNQASGERATIAGGAGNLVTAYAATVGGGMYNVVAGTRGTIAGGQDNVVSGTHSFIGAGTGNVITNSYAVVGGGWQNTVAHDYAVVGGGHRNAVTGQYAVIGGGMSNSASAPWSVVPGGSGNSAAGSYSFAAGRRAQANAQGCFVWGDSTDADVACSAANQWVVRASGGVYFYSNSALTAGVYLPAGASAWQPVPAPSDRNLKENIQPVDVKDILKRLQQVPIAKWNYIADQPVPHIGPMAQDFYAAFGVGEDELHISTIDANGVALAAIQGLYQIVQEKDAQIAAQQKQIDDLQARLSALEALVAQLAKEGGR